MEAKLKYEGDVAVISIEGSLKIERTQAFREVCLNQFVNQKVVFNMKNASFVGSTGLQAFLSTLTSFEEKSQHGVKLVALKPEFKRVIGSMQLTRIHIHEDESTAINAFQASSSSSVPG